MTTTAEQIDNVLNKYGKFISNIGIIRRADSYAGREARQVLLDIIAAAVRKSIIEELEVSLIAGLIRKEREVAVKARIAELEGGENYEYDDVRDTPTESRAKEKRDRTR